MIIVGNPGTHPELLYGAAGLAEVCETQYWTASLLSHRSALPRLARRCPPGAWRVRRAVDARTAPAGVSSRLIKSAAVWEVGFQTALRLSPANAPRFLERRNRAFSGAVAGRIRGLQCRVVVGQQTAARALFEAAPYGCLKVLNYPIAHHRWSEDYLSYEAARNPAWAGSLQVQGLDETVLRQLDAEVSEADFILVASSFVRRTFTEAGIAGSKLIVLPLGTHSAHPAEKQFRPGGRPLRLLFAGQVVQRKGLSYLVEALGRLPAGRVDVRFVGPIAESTAQLLTDYGWTVLGSQPFGEMRRHYIWADLLVLPSLVEGFGLTALEAMAVGTPALVSEHSFGRDILHDGTNGFVVPPADSASILGKIDDILAGSVDLAAVSRRAFETASSLTWEEYGRRFARSISAIASSAQGGQ